MRLRNTFAAGKGSGFNVYPGKGSGFNVYEVLIGKLGKGSGFNLHNELMFNVYNEFSMDKDSG